MVFLTCLYENGGWPAMLRRARDVRTSHEERLVIRILAWYHSRGLITVMEVCARGLRTSWQGASKYVHLWRDAFMSPCLHALNDVAEWVFVTDMDELWSMGPR